MSLAASGTKLEPGRIRQVHNSFVAAPQQYFSEQSKACDDLIAAAYVCLPVTGMLFLA